MPGTLIPDVFRQICFSDGMLVMGWVQQLISSKERHRSGVASRDDPTLFVAFDEGAVTGIPVTSSRSTTSAMVRAFPLS
jgi:hypothetical protein